jgi:hypothetical protein
MRSFYIPSLHIFLIVLLAYVSINTSHAQTYASITDVPANKWDFTVVDLNKNPVTTLSPSTRYFLRLSLNSGVTVGDLNAYIIQDGDGWYSSEFARPQQFPTGTDADSYYSSTAKTTYYSFFTEEASDFSGAFFKIRLSATGSLSGSPGSAPKSKLFQ